MDELSKITTPVPKQSVPGIASVIIGSINIVIFIYQLVQWILLNPALLENPGKINGTHVPGSVM